MEYSHPLKSVNAVEKGKLRENKLKKTTVYCTTHSIGQDKITIHITDLGSLNFSSAILVCLYHSPMRLQAASPNLCPTFGAASAGVDFSVFFLKAIVATTECQLSILPPA
jgi:hypothetical protein